MAGTEDDERLHDLPPDRVGARHHGRFEDGRVLEESALDLEGPDPVPRGDDDVVGAADEPEIAVLVAPGAVPGQVVLATSAGLRLFRVLPVLAEERRWRAAPGGLADLSR